MKKYLVTIIIILYCFSTFGQTENITSEANYHKAYQALQNMLEGKDSLNYEKAVFIIKDFCY